MRIWFIGALRAARRKVPHDRRYTMPCGNHGWAVPQRLHIARQSSRVISDQMRCFLSNRHERGSKPNQNL